MSCDNFFVLEIYNEKFLNEWVPLETCLPGNATNCGPNTYVFLNLMNRINGQIASEISESTILVDREQLLRNERKYEKEELTGTDFNFISNKLNEDNHNKRAMFRQYQQTINNDINILLNFFREKLKPNQITILNIKGQSVGHILTIAKGPDEELVLLDPQISKGHHGDEAIKIYLNNWGTITDFSYYCIDNELKRAISNLQSTIRKKQDIGEPPLKKVSRTGFSVGKSQ